MPRCSLHSGGGTRSRGSSTAPGSSPTGASCAALTVHLDRLEGRAAIAAGDHPRGLELLQRAGHSFADLGATWERARTELDVADVLTAAARTDEARSMLDTATPDLERAGALIEIERLRSLREGLA